jgi:hypothetical protein
VLSQLFLCGFDGSVMECCFNMDSRPERCKSGVGSRGGLQRIKEVMHTIMLAGIGRQETREIGIRALIYLARFLSISSLIKITIAFFLLSILDSFFWWK